MRTSESSPFHPGSDNDPEIWAGRFPELDDWNSILRRRRVSGQDERGRVFLGEPGVGKSSLVTRITNDARRRGDWVTGQIRIPTDGDPMKRVASALLELADGAGLLNRPKRKLKALLARVRNIAALGVSVDLDSPDGGEEPYVALTNLMIEVGTAAVEQGDVAVVIHIDEIQNIEDDAVLSQILTALGDALSAKINVPVPGDISATRYLPLAIYLTGLPEFESMAHGRKGATFSRRMATSTLGPVTDDDVRDALQDLVTRGWDTENPDGSRTRVYLASDARDAIIDLSKGEPFLLQLAGAHAWYEDENSDVITRDHVLAGWEKHAHEAENHVARIVERLPDQERRLVDAMAQLEAEDRSLTKVADLAGFPRASDAGTAARRLDTVRGIIARGRPYSFRNRAVEAYLTTQWPMEP